MQLIIQYGYPNGCEKATIDSKNIQFVFSIREGKQILGDPKVGDLVPKACLNCKRNEDHSNKMCDSIHDLVLILSIEKRWVKKSKWLSFESNPTSYKRKRNATNKSKKR